MKTKTQGRGTAVDAFGRGPIGGTSMGGAGERAGGGTTNKQAGMQGTVVEQGKANSNTMTHRGGTNNQSSLHYLTVVEGRRQELVDFII